MSIHPREMPSPNLHPASMESLELAEIRANTIQINADNARLIMESLQRASLGDPSLEKMVVMQEKEGDGDSGYAAVLQHVKLDALGETDNHAIRIDFQEIIDGKTVEEGAELLGYMRVFPVSEDISESAKVDAVFNTGGQFYLDEACTEPITVDANDVRYKAFTKFLSDARIQLDLVDEELRIMSGQ